MTFPDSQYDEPSAQEDALKQEFERLMEHLHELTQKYHDSDLHVIGAVVLPTGLMGLSLSCGNEATFLIIHALWERLDEEHRVQLLVDLHVGRSPITRASSNGERVN